MPFQKSEVQSGCVRHQRRRALLVLLAVAVFVIGPERMPQYAAKLVELVKQFKALADVAKEQMREQMGPDFDDVDWK
jgi:sec-independent protein translocase protein TatB